ncbi:hypothetical protein CISG_04219 [Coccidioides immitis RMSCC 3703]|uniref:protein-ribulosamine 3-kinase n=2 Tax=Coccidioides immitis TaxID=5501 RepID=A0A0J8TLE9_COCIT|nr:hypothetical protein CIRG_02279 [Coccidioides immitis RMSCC 2394]KMU74512.1 hypothetical protein CISG_04219 [Coccidioides immitis RMSCC 3703]
MAGTFEAETALHAIIPNHVPKPTAWGTYKTQSDIHFYLCEFVEMSDRLPSCRQWAEATSQLHVRSAGKCPQGRSKFGFHITTHLANIPIDNSWHDSWESFWAWQMKSLLKHEERIRGPNHEFSRLKQSFFDKVIPRLLRPLEARGRRINACLIHSDLWPGNVMHKAEVRDLVMFDSCPYWGHNEADLAVCRNPRYRLGKAYVEAYRRCMPEFPSHPTEDFEDRNALYAMKFHILLSILYPSDSRYRRILMDEMRQLAEKFPTGYASYEEKEEIEIVEEPILLSYIDPIAQEEDRKRRSMKKQRESAVEGSIPLLEVLLFGVLAILIALPLGFGLFPPEKQQV